MRCTEEYYPLCKRHLSHCRSFWTVAKRSTLTQSCSVSTGTLSHLICWRSHSFLKTENSERGNYGNCTSITSTVLSYTERLGLGCCSKMRTKIWVTSQRKHRWWAFYSWNTKYTPLTETFTHRCPYWHRCPPLSHITGTSGHGDVRSWVINREPD